MNLGRRCVENLDTKVANTGSEQLRNDFGGTLRHRIEQRVAAADVGRQWVFHANPVSQFDNMIVARTTAVVFVGPGREYRTEDAVLHVEHRHVLVNDDFQPRGRSRLNKVQQLFPVQVVRSCHAFAALVDEKLSRQLVRNVQRKVRDDGDGSRRVVPQAGEVSDEDAVRFVFLQSPKDAGFVRFLNSWCRDEDSGRSPMSKFDGLPVFADVLEIDHHAVNVGVEHRFELTQ